MTEYSISNFRYEFFHCAGDVTRRSEITSESSNDYNKFFDKPFENGYDFFQICQDYKRICSAMMSNMKILVEN